MAKVQSAYVEKDSMHLSFFSYFGPQCNNCPVKSFCQIVFYLGPYQPFPPVCWQ